MSSIISAKLKKIGQREYNNIRIEVPKKLSEKFKKPMDEDELKVLIIEGLVPKVEKMMEYIKNY